MLQEADLRKRRSILSKGFFVGLAIVIMSPVHAGGWLKKVLNAQPTQPRYQYQPNYQPHNTQSILAQYNLRMSSSQLHAGQPTLVVADILVQGGNNEPIQGLAVRYTLIDLRGQSRGQATKAVEVKYPNGYQSNLRFTPPRGIPRGRYRVEGELLINGTPRATRAIDYEII